MRRVATVALLSLGIGIAASGCVSAARSGGGEPGMSPAWRARMAAGLDAWDLGQRTTAVRHYRAAVRLAQREGLPAEERAFSSYRLGDAIRLHPEAGQGESAMALLDESRRHFERAYGPDHPVLIPVWVRIASLRAAGGDEAAARAARAAADRIAVRCFPESHFLRERYGSERPASLLHPLEMLQLVAAAGGETPGRVVRGP